MVSTMRGVINDAPLFTYSANSAMRPPYQQRKIDVNGDLPLRHAIHAKIAMIIFGTIAGIKVRPRCCAAVAIHPARQFPEVGFASEVISVIGTLDPQRHGIAEAQD